jgi:hypothetical protein
MKYISLVLTTFLYVLFEYVYCFRDLNYKSLKRVLSYSNWFGEKIIGWNTNTFININDKENIPDKLVIISNHINFIDAVIIPNLLVNKFTEHKLMFITREKYGNIPIIGQYFRKNHILIKNNLEEDLQLIKKKINDFTKLNKKIIILIFPEGTFMTNNTIKNSNNYCNKISIQPYKRCLAPRTSGIFSILNIIKPTLIGVSSIIYTDNLQNNKGTKYSHFLYDYFPKFCNVSLKLINIDKFNLENRKEFDDEFYEFWRNEYDTNIFL